MINRNIFSTSLPTVVNVANYDSHLDGVDPCLREQIPSDILCNLPDSRNVDKSDLPFPGFAEKAFYCLRQTSIPRYQCLKLITWSWFERVSMFVILLNCVTLGMYQPCAQHAAVHSPTKCDTTRCIWLEAMDYFVFAFFTIEMCVKMISMGVFGPRSYFAESWNRLDCFIVVTGYDHLFATEKNRGFMSSTTE
jgi:Ion transport protein